MATGASADPLIVRRPGIQGGEPIIRGTRVPVRSIALSLREDHPGDPAAVAEAYHIDVAAVEAARNYYREHRAEIDRIIEQHERAVYNSVDDEPTRPAYNMVVEQQEHPSQNSVVDQREHAAHDH